MGKTNLIAEPGKQEMTFTRTFDAPPELVFRAHVDPELLKQWLGPRRLKMRVEQMDVRPGGSYRYVHIDTDRTEYGFHGVFHLVDAPRRIIQTFEFEGMPGHVSLDTLTLEDANGKTQLTGHSVFQSVADRDGALQSGMEDGMNEGMDRLDEIFKELQKARVR